MSSYKHLFHLLEQAIPAASCDSVDLSALRKLVELLIEGIEVDLGTLNQTELDSDIDDQVTEEFIEKQNELQSISKEDIKGSDLMESPLDSKDKNGTHETNEFLNRYSENTLNSFNQTNQIFFKFANFIGCYGKH